MEALARRFDRERLDRRSDLMPMPYGAKDTAAEGFGPEQRASWAISVLTDAPVVVYAVSGWADGRPVDEPQPAEDAMQPGATSAPPRRAWATRPAVSPTSSNAPCASGPAPHGASLMRKRPAAALGGLLAAALVLVPATTAHADTIRDRQWALDALHADQVWPTTRGAGITVAVLDTGVEADHPDLDGNVLEGKDLVGFGAREGDEAWARHGTAMAGIIAGHGHGPGNGDGVLGVAPEAKILPVRVILEDKDPARAKARSTRGSASPKASAGPPTTAPTSSTSPSATTPPPRTRRRARTRRSSTRCARAWSSSPPCGNGGEKGDRISYPAAYPGVIAATAVDRYGTRAPFSTRRWYATVSAPGVDVIIADPDHRYYEGWGTSAAAAFVSGAVALLKAAHRDLTPAQIKRLLEDTARTRPPPDATTPRLRLHRPGRSDRGRGPSEAGGAEGGGVRRRVLRPGAGRRRTRRRHRGLGGAAGGGAAVFFWSRRSFCGGAAARPTRSDCAWRPLVQVAVP